MENRHRTNSNIRTESLERILGDKAQKFFDQMEKIYSYEHVKVNRSLMASERENSVSKEGVTLA